MNARTNSAAPVSMVAIGLMLVILASLAVMQSRGISVAPVSSDNTTLFEPRGGQMPLFAPPYCSGGVICGVLDAVISVFNSLSNAFPFLAPVFSIAIGAIQQVQTGLGGGFGFPFGFN